MPRPMTSAWVAVVLAACTADGAMSLETSDVDATTRGMADPAEGTFDDSSGGTGSPADAPRHRRHGEGGGSDEGGVPNGGPGFGDPPGPAFARVDVALPHTVVFGTLGPGSAWADFDGDGWLDLLTVGGAAPSRLWHNDHGTLVESALDADLSGILDTAAVTAPDFDNDGDPDVLLLGLDEERLLRNDGGVALVDVTATAGLQHIGRAASATWGDYDRDGILDLFLAIVGSDDDVLFHGLGAGQFEDRTDLLPEDVSGQSYAASFSDFDDDGDVDLYVVIDKNVGNRMWRNDGPGCGGWCFTLAKDWGAGSAIDGMGLGVGDIDNDLDLDVSFSDTDHHNLLRQDQVDGQPAFVDVSVAYGVDYDAHGWGTVLFDYDNDGWLDLFVADSQLPDPSSRMFRNLDGMKFDDVSDDCGCVDSGWAFGVSYADFDQDGWLDFVVGNRSLGHSLYRNRAVGQGHWLSVELEGGGPVNRDAVGARVVVHTSMGLTLRRDVEIGSSVASQHSLRQHFGLGHGVPVALEIRWPDGTFQALPAPAADSHVVYAYPG